MKKIVTVVNIVGATVVVVVEVNLQHLLDRGDGGRNVVVIVGFGEVIVVAVVVFVAFVEVERVVGVGGAVAAAELVLSRGNERDGVV